MMIRTIKIFLVVFSVSLFLISLFQECFTVEGKESLGSFGSIALLLGIFNTSHTWICWFANPFFIISCIFIFFNNKVALLLSALTVVLSVSFYFLDEVIIDEAGHVGTIDEYKSGYWLWLTSHITMFVGALYLKQKVK